MTTFAQWRSPASRGALSRLEQKPRKYDLRVVDQFYRYCQAISRTDRHRDEVHTRSQHAMRRTLWTMLVAGSFLFYYLIERAAQAMSLF
ncbi:MAG: hypothetical protein HYY78_16165 [Betaproteobacteria bacterium]|nr:hypothetical protein [Betaproteobacteria bacterium]